MIGDLMIMPVAAALKLIGELMHDDPNQQFPLVTIENCLGWLYRLNACRETRVRLVESKVSPCCWIRVTFLTLECVGEVERFRNKVMATNETNEMMSPEVLSIYQNLLGIRNKLAQLKQSGDMHTMDDLRKYRQMLDAIDQKRQATGIFAGTMQTPGQAACMEALDEAYDLLEYLISTASELNGEMNHIYCTLNGIYRKLNHMKHQKMCSLEDLRHYQQMLNSIDSKRVDGIYAGSPTTNIPAGQGLCADVLALCYELVDELRPMAQELGPEMDLVFSALLKTKEKLLDMKANNVEHLLSHLHPFQVQLDEIDKSRVEGIFAGSLKSGKIPAGQAVCADLLDECYQLVRDLQACSLDYATGSKAQFDRDATALPQA